jgi:hypothetical protein
MNISYNISQYKQASKDVIDIYKLAEEKMKLSPIPYSLVQLRNAFQVFRYAFREWSLTQDRGVVLRALMLADARAKEVRCNSREMVIQVDDSDVALALERLLEGDGYTEESN